MIPDNVEKIIMTKEDYDRNVEKLLVDKCKAELETEKLHSIIKEVREWVEKHIEKYEKNGIQIIDWDTFSDPRKLLEILDKEKDNV